MKIEIKNIYTGAVIFAHDVENNTMALTVKAALRASVRLSEANLRGANLREADLREANLSEANLREADLCGANLRGVNLSGANLSGVNLSGANLSGANLSEADLCGVNLSEANLRGVNLSEANLSGANLSGANLSGANLSYVDLSGASLAPIRDDIWSILSASPAEVPALISALKNGKVDGSTYEGDCCCLVGTIANAKGCRYGEIAGIIPNSSRPAERFFLGIKKGDTPETSRFSALAVQWAEEWMQKNLHSVVKHK